MRPVLIRLLLDHPWQPWASDVRGVPGIGIALFLAILMGVALAWRLLRRGWPWTVEDRWMLAAWGLLLLVVTVGAPRLPEPLGRWFPTPDSAAPATGPAALTPQPITSLPIFGYGFFVLLGFLTAWWVGERRAIRAGYDLSQVFDLMFWTLLCGVVGGRTFYLLQYREQVFAHAEGTAGVVLAAVNLSNGGLVLIGAMLGGAVGFFTYCRLHAVPALAYLDLLTPSIFLAVALGRIGCLMYGCCYGDPCTLPWSVTFGPESAAFQALEARGFLSRQATATMPLHPTQIYSAIDGLLLALVTYAYYPFRARTGQAFALGMILYPITRFFIEFLRGDELGQLGTGLTISQLLSLVMLGGGLLLAWRLQRTGSRPGVAQHEGAAGLTAA